MPLLEGTDGVQKMSKSLGNHIGIAEPPGAMFGKLMSIPDALIVRYFALLTDVDASHVSELERKLKTRAVNPRDAKADLAVELVSRYHSPEAAQQVRQEFFKVFSRRELPSDIPEHPLPAGRGDVDLAELLVGAKLAKSKNDARRLLKQGSVKLNGAKVQQAALPRSQAAGGVLQVGSRHFRRLVAAR
jgi:tyrosyl-tRNA synthetase